MPSGSAYAHKKPPSFHPARDRKLGGTTLINAYAFSSHTVIAGAALCSSHRTPRPVPNNFCKSLPPTALSLKQSLSVLFSSSSRLFIQFLSILAVRLCFVNRYLHKIFLPCTGQFLYLVNSSCLKRYSPIPSSKKTKGVQHTC